MAGGSASNEQIREVLADHGRKSEVWNNYNMVVLQDGIKKAQCKRCGVLLAITGNSTLKRHTEGTCKALKGGGGESSQPILDNQGQIWSYDDALARQMTTKCVIQMGLPFGHFNNPYLTKMIKGCLQPRYQPVSRQTLRRDALEMWKNAKNEMRDMFSQMPNNVSLTCDVWSAPHGLPNSYICITATWMQEWQLVKRVITFEPFGAPHSGERQFSIIKKALMFYNLSNKIVSISFDNASNNNACVEKLKCALTPMLDGEIFHTRCVAHIINLAVQDGLDTCKLVLDKFRIMLRRIFSKGKAMHAAYRRYCKQCDFRALGPNFDMPVRWNSTYFMIQNLLAQQVYIHAFYKTHYPNNSIGDWEWEVIGGLYDILSDFKTATTWLSGCYYPTSPLVLSQLFMLATKIKEYEQKEQWGALMSSMKKKLLKYFREIPFSFLLAAALNPWLNVTGVEVLIAQISEAFALDTETDSSFSTKRITTFNRRLIELFEIYKVRHGGGSQSQSSRQPLFTSGSSSSGSRQNRMASLINVVHNESSKKKRYEHDLDELQIYMNTTFTMNHVDNFEELNILEFWQEKQQVFPVLATMARDILTIQASTVASESAFSLSGRIISERRTRLTPESVECLVCLKDYLDSIDRIQNQTDLEAEIPVVDENFEENEINEGLSSPPDTDSASVVSQYDDERFDVDDLDDGTALTRFQDTGTLQYYQPWQD